MRSLVLILFIILISCNLRQKEFSIEDWNYKEDTFFVKRKLLVQDLLNNKLHKGMQIASIVKMLGNPEDYNNTPMSIEYEIEEKYGWDIDPIRGSYIQISFNSDSMVTSIDFVKWKN